jgi:hypothetical protein
MRRPRTPVPSGVWALSSQSTILLGYGPASVILAGCRHVVPSALLWRKQGKSNLCVLRQFRLPNVWEHQVICTRLCSRPQECGGAGDGFWNSRTARALPAGHRRLDHLRKRPLLRFIPRGHACAGTSEFIQHVNHLLFRYNVLLSPIAESHSSLPTKLTSTTCFCTRKNIGFCSLTPLHGSAPNKAPGPNPPPHLIC